MDDEALRYDLWIEEALRQVIYRALELTAKEGLPGDHHFYITFRTGADGIEVPPYLRAQHPDEMTIVLQHQFDDLLIDAEGFSVSLRFNGKPEKLVIPFEAVTSFADPSVNFGLQLKTVDMDDAEFEELAIDPVNSIDDLAAAELNDTGEPELDEDGKPKTGEVIALDSFRKK
ncbi:MAG: hypothetical protein HOH04_12355 [Rhodospirillaceae bacterium]|jgi:uncharacterized protein|nr:hypothetical protein [Rhodospirillaceae bacterium]